VITSDYKKKERQELCLMKQSVDNVSEYSKIVTDLNKEDSDGVYIIDTGKCRIVNPFD
jgi:hypothetical protein